MVARIVRDDEVRGSNPRTPTDAPVGQRIDLRFPKPPM